MITNKSGLLNPWPGKQTAWKGLMTVSIVPAQRHYVDTLSVRTVQPFSQPVRNRLRRTGSHAIHFGSTPNPFDRQYAHRTQLTVPTDSQLLILLTATKRHPKPPKINRLDLKLEILTDRPDELRELIEQFLVKPNHRNCHVRRYKNTRYTGHKNSASQLVTYSDKGSKLDGSKCVQVEWRFVGRRAIERIGVKTIEDVISFDHQAFWLKRFRLAKVKVKTLGKAWLRKQEKKGNPIKAGKEAIKRVKETREGTTQDVIDWCVRNGVAYKRILETTPLEKCP